MAASVTAIPKTEEGGNFFTRMAWYYQMGILLGLVALLLFAADAAFYGDTRAQTRKIRDDTNVLKAENQQGEAIRQNLITAEATLKEKKAEIEGLRELLPDQVEISTVYDDIKDFMRQQKLELRRFIIGKTTPSEFYTAQPIDIEVSGAYDNLGQFFSSLGFFKRIVSVTDVQVKQSDDNAQLSGRSIESTFTVTAYYITPENLSKLTSKKPAAPTAGDKNPPPAATPKAK
jgi:type IV pilus assembly protein PilO